MSKFLRFIAILFMGISAALTLLGGIGTTCVALDAAKYDSMKALAEYQWLYILYVLAGVVIGVLGVRATIRLAKGRRKADKAALLVLVLGFVVGVIHMITSRALRGMSMPVDFIVYFTGLTLLVFLALQIPAVRDKVQLEREDGAGEGAAGGMAAIIAGMLFLSVQMWAGPSHMINGVNYADAFRTAMQVGGAGLVLAGLGLFVRDVLLRAEPVPCVQRSEAVGEQGIQVI